MPGIYAEYGAGGNQGAAISLGGTQDTSNCHGVTLSAAPATSKGKPWQKGKGSSKGKEEVGR